MARPPAAEVVNGVIWPDDAGDGSLAVTSDVSSPTLFAKVNGEWVQLQGGSGGSTDSIQFSRVAAVVLSGHRVVAPRADGTVEYASAAVLTDATRPLWLTLGAALAGGPVSVQALGEVVEPSWAWAPGIPLWLGLNGAVTQIPPTAPTAAFLMQVGLAETLTSAFFDPKIPFVLA